MNSILKDFGDRIADEIKPSKIDLWLKERDWSPAMKSHYKSVVGKTFKLAHADSKVAGNPERLVEQPSSTLKEGGRSDIEGHDWLRSALIVWQVTRGIVLTAGTGLLISAFTKLTLMDEGFHPDHVLTFTFELPDQRYKDTRLQFYRKYFEKLRALPGVEPAGGSKYLPMVYDLATIGFEDL